jgi:tRNA pseudouridine38-40 synthase
LIRIKITIKYDGSKFYGFAKQIKYDTVYSYLSRSFAGVDEYEKIIGSGRTDKGVHATGQVFHIDIKNHWKNQLHNLKYILNRSLKHIEIININIVDFNFHARFSAKKRTYRYIFSTKTNIFNSSYVTAIDKLDLDKSIKALQIFEGWHNFKFFSKQDKENKNQNRFISKTDLYKYKTYYIFKITGNSFLRSQIRMMISFIIDISNDKLTTDNLLEQLNLKHRYSSNLVEPNGLYLCRVHY